MIRKSPTGGKKKRKKEGRFPPPPSSYHFFFRARKCGPLLLLPSCASAPGNFSCPPRRCARPPPPWRRGGSVCCLCLLLLPSRLRRVSHSTRHQNILRPTGEEDENPMERKETESSCNFRKGSLRKKGMGKRVGGKGYKGEKEGGLLYI